ncbi:MAG: hypothetical protein VYC39_02160 [Myxococcota bacterium]|nr:hypothetical protein [Myxococcota bacterium]
MSRLLAVLGRDVSRSLSPHLHNSASKQCDLDVRYVALNCASDEAFLSLLEDLQVLGARGCNVTIPYKMTALKAAHECTPMAMKLGAANTLTFENNKIWADNTDGPGLLRVLVDYQRDELDCVQILGAGGAARAAVWAAREAGARKIVVTARRNAESVVEIAPGVAAARTLSSVEEATLVISTLPNKQEIADKALKSWISVSQQPLILDLAYGSSTSLSPLAAQAKRAGLKANDGRGMLVEQAALSLSHWVGGQVSEKIRKSMWEALDSAAD